jgi:hypothetical protein
VGSKADSEAFFTKRGCRKCYHRCTSLAVPIVHAHNLQFSTILALSNGPSWRTRGLEAATSLTGLNIVIPTQPPIGHDIVQFFEEFGPSDPRVRKPSAGSARAWLAHLDLLKFVVASQFSTALIVEDDVDWDMSLRSQMQLVSDNVRKFTRVAEDDPHPYGTDWDVLWIGHCGEVPTADAEKLVYPDSSRMPSRLYAGWSKKLQPKIPEGHRQVQYLQQTVCTFGYGVTAEGARRILQVLSSGQDEAFDVGLQHKCRQGALRCVTVNPEVMHHYNPKDGTGYVSQTAEGDGKGQSSQNEAFETLKGTTANMIRSARCAALLRRPVRRHHQIPRPTEDERYQRARKRQ